MKIGKHFWPQKSLWKKYPKQKPERAGDFWITTHHHSVEKRSWFGLSENDWHDVIAWTEFIIPKPYNAPIGFNAYGAKLDGLQGVSSVLHECAKLDSINEETQEKVANLKAWMKQELSTRQECTLINHITHFQLLSPFGSIENSDKFLQGLLWIFGAIFIV